MFYFSNARSFPLIVFSLLERFGIFLCPRYIAAPGWEVGNPVAGQRLSFCSGGRGSFNVCMWSVNSDVLDLISRIQRLLAICRLWIHESRGRLDTAFLEISALRVRLRSLAAELREARSEEFRTFFDFNSRLLAVKDTVEETLEQQALVLRGLESRVKEVSAGVVLLLFALL